MKNIGIVPGVRVGSDYNWYIGEYFFTDTYTTKVEERNLNPIGIIPTKGMVKTDILEMCDAFLLCGGQRMMPYHLQVIDYAVRTGKKLLGICLGMQAIHTYFIVRNEKEKRKFDGSIIELYEIMKKERYYFVEPVSDHNSVKPVCFEDENIREINTRDNTMLSKLIGEKVHVAMRHSYRITTPEQSITISAFDEDGITIEGIERGNTILAVQFHPELYNKLDSIFDWLAE